jgi:hypothetical protein
VSLPVSEVDFPMYALRACLHGRWIIPDLRINSLAPGARAWKIMLWEKVISIQRAPCNCS